MKDIALSRGKTLELVQLSPCSKESQTGSNTISGVSAECCHIIAYIKSLKCPLCKIKIEGKHFI